MKKMGMPLLFACVPLLAGCYAGIGHMLEEDYNPRFAVGEYEELEEVQQEEVPPPPEKVQEYTVADGSYGLQGLASGTVGGATYIVSLATPNYNGPFPLPADMRWFLETPEGVPKQRVDITYCYTPPTRQAGVKESYCLTLPSQLELGLTYITSTVSPGNAGGTTYRDQYNPDVKTHYKVIGEGTLDDGTLIRIKSGLITIPTI